MRISTVLAAGLMLISLNGCDRLKSFLSPSSAAAAPEASSEAAGPSCGEGTAREADDIAKLQTQEAAAIAASGDTARRQGRVLTILYAGRTIATVEGCGWSVYTGQIMLLNPASRKIEPYSVATTEMNQSVIFDHDGTPNAFEGKVVASPDGRYVASGEAYMDYMNAELMITDWTSAGRNDRVGLRLDCSPSRWTDRGLEASCDRTDPSRFFSDAVVSRDGDGWVLQETRLNPSKLDPRTAAEIAPHAPDKLLRLTSVVLWPEDSHSLVDQGITRVWPAAGDAAARSRPPSAAITLRDSEAVAPSTFMLKIKPDGERYGLTDLSGRGYSFYSPPIASPDGRYVALIRDDALPDLIDWTAGRQEVLFDHVWCATGVWTADNVLMAECHTMESGEYAEARITPAANGAWTYAELYPVRRTRDHRWERYDVPGFTPRTLTGKPGQTYPHWES